MATASNLPAERRANPVVVLQQSIETMAPELQKALPAHVSVEKFIRVAKTAIINNPDLQKAERASLFGAIGRLAQDGLLPDGRESAIVMFGTKAQAMPMIAGILKKLRQSGEIAKVSAQVVYEHDEFVWHLGFDEDVTHNPPRLDEPRGKAIGAYATAVLKDGSRLLEVMSLEEIEKVRAVSRAKNNGPWVQWWGEMARKTVMRRLSKRLPMSTDLMDDLDRDPTMAPEPTAIQHQDAPASRLDALEYQIDTEADDLESSPAGTPTAEAGSSNTDGDAGAVQEGLPDEERGDGDSDAGARAAIEAYAKAVRDAPDQASLEAVWQQGNELAATIRADFPDLYAEIDNFRPADAPERGEGGR